VLFLAVYSIQYIGSGGFDSSAGSGISRSWRWFCDKRRKLLIFKPGTLRIYMFSQSPWVRDKWVEIGSLASRVSLAVIMVVFLFSSYTCNIHRQVTQHQ
jgi:hypothetical protein